MKIKVLIAIALVSLTVLIIFAPRFLFRKARISAELNSIVEAGVRIGISIEDASILDYYGRWNSMYVKLELPTEKYDQVKRNMLLLEGTATSKDFSGEISIEESGYRYDSNYFHTLLSVISNAKKMGEYNSMNLNDNDEILIMDTTYRKIVFFVGTTGARNYVLVKGNRGNCYLYILKY